VHFDDAYVDICDLPYLPCNGEARCKKCPFKTGIDRRCFAHRNKRLYEHSATNWFVSPLHRDVVEQRLESQRELSPSAVCRPLLDPEPFREAGANARERPLELLYVGPFVEAKGLDNVDHAIGLEKVHAVGRSPRTRLRRSVTPPFASVRPPVAPAEMPALLASARRLVALPRWPEPQGRIALEASLAGCEVIGNDRVGAFSFGPKPTDDRLYAGAAEDFWERLEALVEH
jgi:glycosyltransferase involved in cell wall biosynthesis